jgi:hypothetical protein
MSLLAIASTSLNGIALHVGLPGLQINSSFVFSVTASNVFQEERERERRRRRSSSKLNEQSNCK